MGNRVSILRGVGAVLLAATFADCAWAAGSLEAFAGVIGGVPTNSAEIPGACSTYGGAFSSFFGSADGLLVPAGGVAGCGYAGSLNDLTAFSGPLTANNSLGSTLLGNPGFAGTYTGSSGATASYKTLGAQASGTITAPGAGTTLALAESEGVAFFDDTLTVNSPFIASLSDGFVRYQFSFHGSLSVPTTAVPDSPGDARAILAIQSQGGSVLTLVTASVSAGQSGAISALDGSTAGWTTDVGSISGSGEYGSTIHGTFDDFDIPINFGTPFELKAGLDAWVQGTGDADFFTTATLDNVQVFDANHNLVSDFTIQSASGTYYGGDLLSPEPGSLLLAIGGILIIVGHRRKRT